MAVQRFPGLTRRKFLSNSAALSVGAFAGVGLTGCGEDASSRTAGGNGASKSVTCVLDVAPYGKHAPFYVAREQGMWADRGLDVDLQSAKGSGDAVTKVGSGAGHFALADTSAAMLARGNQGLQTKVVCMYHYKNLMSVLTLEGNGISEPADLEGKKMHVLPGEGTFLMLPALAEANDFDADNVETVVGEVTGLIQAVVSGQVDGALTYYTFYPSLEAAADKAGKTPNALLYAEYGVDVYNNGIVVADEFAKSDPDTVRAFCEGLVDAVVETVRDPDAATELFVKSVPGTDPKIARAQLDVAIDHLNVPEVKANGFGPMDTDKMKHTVELVNKYFTLDTPVTDPADIYSNEFVPAGKIPSL
ncbi:MAG: ABC transporter substrate-binding protein [Gaiellales bacterium]